MNWFKRLFGKLTRKQVTPQPAKRDIGSLTEKERALINAQLDKLEPGQQTVIELPDGTIIRGGVSVCANVPLLGTSGGGGGGMTLVATTSPNDVSCSLTEDIVTTWARLDESNNNK